jgi:hypothetical protein
MKIPNKELLLMNFQNNPVAAGYTWEAYEGKKNKHLKRFKTFIGSIDIKIIYDSWGDEWTYKSKALRIDLAYMEKGITPQKAAEYAVEICRKRLLGTIEILTAAKDAFFQKGY